MNAALSLQNLHTQVNSSNPTTTLVKHLPNFTEYVLYILFSDQCLLSSHFLLPTHVTDDCLPGEDTPDR